MSGPPASRAGAELPRPPSWRDPWAWACLLGILPALLLCGAAPLGEPIADDYDFMHVARFGPHRLLDGGGSPLYWRPLARQAYFGLVTPLLLRAPAAVAALHAVALALAAWLLYRALRRSWPAPWAAAAATFPLLLDTTRMLVGWASHFQDIGALLFGVLALHEGVRRRPWSAAGALLASLLCKEVAVAAALLLPWMPGVARTRGERGRWLAVTAGVVAAWGALYAVVLWRGSVIFPPSPAVAALGTAPAWPVSAGWALGRCAADALGLVEGLGRGRAAYAAVLAALLAAPTLLAALRPAARARLRRAAPWIAWGAAWFVIATLPLAGLFPDWAPNRGTLGVLGLGVATSAWLGAAHPALLAGLLAARLWALGAAPPPPARIERRPPASSYAFDFVKQVRLQRLGRETRRVLQAARPRLEPGAEVAWHYFPRQVQFAFSGDRALQLWYGDATLRWISSDGARRSPPGRVAALVEFQPFLRRQVAVVEPEAMRGLLDGSERIESEDWSGALRALGRADSAQSDRGAAVLLGSIAGKRALALAATGRHGEAETEARRALALWPENGDPRYLLAWEWFQQGRYAPAQAQLESLLAVSPADPAGRQLYRQVREARRLSGR